MYQIMLQSPPPQLTQSWPLHNKQVHTEREGGSVNIDHKVNKNVNWHDVGGLGVVDIVDVVDIVGSEDDEWPVVVGDVVSSMVVGDTEWSGSIDISMIDDDVAKGSF